MVEVATRPRAPWRRRCSSTETVSLVLDLGDGWELLAGRDGRPYLRGPDSRLREVGLSPAPREEWLPIVRERLTVEGIYPEVREALEHTLLRWGG